MTITDLILAINSYFFAFGWGISILLSLIGWGSAVNHILFPQNRVDWGQRAAWGIAFSIFLGGLLNFTWLISPITIWIYLGLGFLYCLFDFYQNRHLFIKSLEQFKLQNQKIFIVAIVGVIGLIAFSYAGWVYTSVFNWYDDGLAYFVFPQKMLQTGSIGPDPFNERQMEASLGGQSFLHTFILSTLSEAHLNIIDPGISLIILIGVILGYLQEKKASKEIIIFLILISFFLPNPKVNISSNLTTTVLFLSLYRTFYWDQLKFNQSFANASIIALITAAICALKSSIIPAGILFWFSSYIFYLWGAKNHRRAVVSEFLLSALLIFICLLPWMLSMYQSSGTLLYPLLGKGYHGSVYSNENYHYDEVTIVQIFKILWLVITQSYFILLIILGILNFISRPWKIEGREPLLSIWISTTLGTLIIALVVGSGPGVERYPIAFVNAAIIVLVSNLLTNKNNQSKTNYANFNSQLIAIFMIGLFMGNLSNYQGFLSKNFPQLLSDIKKGIKNESLISEQEISSYYLMQQSLPEGETVLTRLDWPFLLNFKRNQIFIADWPGGASLPPGMPLFQGGEVLSEYLLSKSIKYVAYSYANEANFTKENFGNRLSPKMRTWQRITAQKAFDFQDSLKELGNSRKRIYDDGKIFVLDLSQKV